MPCVEEFGTLICYAGSASEASIGSRPIGSELDRDMVIVWLKSQELLNRALLAAKPMRPSWVRP